MRRSLALAVLSLSLAAPLAAQSRDSTLVAAVRASTDSLIRLDTTTLRSWCGLSATTATRKKACATIARLHRQIAADAVAFWPRVTPVPTPVPVPVPTPTPVPTVPSGPGIAELPRITPSAAYPVVARTVRLSAGADIQAAFNAAAAGNVELVLPVGSTFIGNFTIPRATASSGWVIVRTDTVPPPVGTRMTPGLARSLRLARILSPNYSPAISTSAGAQRWRFVGIEVTASPAADLMNSLVRFNDAADRSLQTLVDLPRDFVIDRSYIHGTPTLDMRRCILLNAAMTVVVDSWVSECHSNQSDAQAILGYSGTLGAFIHNNYLESSHEIVAFGGGDPPNITFVPSDITLTNNHISRPSSWKAVWQTKNVMETKDVQRFLVEGNVIENTWEDAQEGFCLVMKSENQENSAPYTQSADITIRYNIIRNCGSGVNFSGKGSSSFPNVAAARFTMTDNLLTGINAPPYTGGGKALQLLSALEDATITHNTFLNAGSSLSAIVFDGGPQVRLVLHSNVMYNGDYGVKGATGAGIPSLTMYAPGALFSHNMLVGADVYPNSCASYPANTFCPTTMPSSLPLGYDGRTIGADLLRVAQATAGVIIPDGLGLGRTRRLARPRTRWTPTPRAIACKATSCIRLRR